MNIKYQTAKRLTNEQVNKYKALTEKLSSKQYQDLRRLSKTALIVQRLHVIASGKVTANKSLIKQALYILVETKQHLILVEAA